MELTHENIKLKEERSNILDICDIQYKSTEPIISFYTKCRSLIINILKKKGERFDDIEILEDEILTPTLDEFIVLWCLEKVDSSLTKDIKHTFSDSIFHGGSILGLKDQLFDYFSNHRTSKDDSTTVKDENKTATVKDTSDSFKSENCELVVTELKTELDDLITTVDDNDNTNDIDWEDEEFGGESDLDNSDKDSDFMSEDSAKRKKTGHENGSEHTCPICKKVCPTVRGLNIHLARHANPDEPRKKVKKEGKGKDVICAECGKSLSSKRRLQEHIKLKHGKNKKYSCKDCDKEFKNASELRTHNEELHKQKKGPEMCPECGKMVHFSSLKRHRLIHLTNIKCDLCGARCLNQEALELHKEKHEKDPEYCKKKERNIQCETCNRKFFDVIEYGSHVCKHFACDSCDAKFVMERNLRKHKKFHAGENIFSCDLCESLYTKRKELLRHMRYAHDPSQRKYKCEMCGKSYLNKTSLNTHKAIHTNEKSYKCDLCGKGFHQKASLHIHMKSHTGEKPFPCLECDMMFRSLTEMKKHRESQKCSGFKAEDLTKSEI